jgi:hypothetical protein
MNIKIFENKISKEEKLKNDIDLIVKKAHEEINKLVDDYKKEVDKLK